MPNKTKNSGFTLIELLVVISIIAVMLAILMPALSRARIQARRVVCASRTKQLLAAALTSAAEDSQGRLPRGGLSSSFLGSAQMLPPDLNIAIYPPPEPQPGPTPSEFVIDDATEMHVEEYFKMGAAMAGQSAFYAGPMETPAVDHVAQQVHQEGLKRVFVCPEAEGKGELFVSELPSSRGQQQYRPAIVRADIANQSVWAARMGYLYFGGFQTGNWVQPASPGRRYRAPVKSTDPGNLVLITDPLWYWPTQKILIIPHTNRGYLQLEGDAAVRNDPRQAYGSAGTNIGSLDGAVEYKMLRDIDLRPAYVENGRYPIDFWTLF